MVQAFSGKMEPNRMQEVGSGIYTIRADSGCTLDVMVITGRKQNAFRIGSCMERGAGGGGGGVGGREGERGGSEGRRGRRWGRKGDDGVGLSVC